MTVPNQVRYTVYVHVCMHAHEARLFLSYFLIHLASYADILWALCKLLPSESLLK